MKSLEAVKVLKASSGIFSLEVQIFQFSVLTQNILFQLSP